MQQPRLTGQQLQTSPQIQQPSKQINPPQLIRLQHAIPAQSFTATSSAQQPSSGQPISANQYAIPISQSTVTQPLTALNLQHPITGAPLSLTPSTQGGATVNLRHAIPAQTLMQTANSTGQPMTGMNLQHAIAGQANLSTLSTISQPISAVIPINCQFTTNNQAIQSTQIIPQSPLSKTQQTTVTLQQQKTPPLQHIQSGVHQQGQQMTTTLLQPQSLVTQGTQQGLLRQPAALIQQQPHQGFTQNATATVSTSQQMPILRPKSPGKPPPAANSRPIQAKSPGRPPLSRSPLRHFKPITPVKQECEKINAVRILQPEAENLEKTPPSDKILHQEDSKTLIPLLPIQDEYSATDHSTSQESKMKSVDLCSGSAAQRENVDIKIESLNGAATDSQHGLYNDLFVLFIMFMFRQGDP